MGQWRFNLVAATSLLLGVAMVTTWVMYRSSAYVSVDLRRLGDFHLDQRNGSVAAVPQWCRDLDGRRVALQGVMWNPNAENVTRFELVAELDEHSRPVVQRFVFCSLVRGRVARYCAQRCCVHGTLHVRLERNGDGITSLYSMDVDDVSVQQR